MSRSVTTSSLPGSTRAGLRWARTRLAETTPASWVLAAGVGGFLALTAWRGPTATSLAALAVVAVVLAARRPEYVLGFGAAGSFANGDFSRVAQLSSLALLGGACVSLLLMAGSRVPGRWSRLVLPLAILSLLALRVLFERDVVTITSLVLCAAALVLVLQSVRLRRDVVTALATAGVAFVVASATFGIDNASGTRFEGISGNPNRMSFALLLLLPFLCAFVARRPHPLLRVVTLAAVAGTVVLLLRSGSAQGLVGLAVIAAVVLLVLGRALPSAVRVLVVTAGGIALLFALGSAASIVRSSTDLRTLSGRTPIYAAALRDIARHPFVGSGAQHFSEGSVLDRSAHSVVLALSVTGGVGLGLAWIAVLVLLVTSTARFLRQGSLLAAAPAALLAEQFVQTIQLLPLTWAVVGLFLLVRDPAELDGGLDTAAREHPHPIDPVRGGRQVVAA